MERGDKLSHKTFVDSDIDSLPDLVEVSESDTLSYGSGESPDSVKWADVVDTKE